MKLQYFNQPQADDDDPILQDAIRTEAVPPTCLLGGKLLEPHLKLSKDPCLSCQGPRARCKGRPASTDQETLYAAERERLRAIFSASVAELDPIQRILNDSRTPR